MPDNEDPVEWVLAARKRINRRDRDFYEKLLLELTEKIGEEGLKKYQETLNKKDADRHTPAFMEILNASMALGPRLLTGNSLKDAVANYFKYHEHAESCRRRQTAT